MRSAWLVALAACSGGAHPGTTASQASPPPTPTSSAIDAIAESALRDGHLPGLSIVVMHGDRVTYARGFGFADRERNIPVTEHSVFPLASLSKQYWATGIAQLVEDGRLSVDSSIADVLYHYPDRRVTVRHLLTQTSGLGDDAPGEDDVEFGDHPTLLFDPGTNWSYSNRGALIARNIVEQITAMPFEHQLHERIAKPLGLASTTTCTGDNHVVLYGRDAKPWALPAGEVQRLAFVCADGLDVARFERALDAGGLLRRETVADMRTPTVIAGVDLPYGWFTRIANLEGHVAFGHTGKLSGAGVAAFRFPADDLTIVVLANTDPAQGFKAHDILARVARAELHLAEPELSEGRVPDDVLGAVTGGYGMGPVHITISARDGRAWLTITVSGGQVWEGALAWLGGRTFAGGPDGTFVDERATFAPAAGRATHILVGHVFQLQQIYARGRAANTSR
jgi:CubicO group peptidase (beta-lactamase class C family)